METELHHLPDYDNIYDRIKHMLIGPTADTVSPLVNTINELYNDRRYIAIFGDPRLHDKLESVTDIYDIVNTYYRYSLKLYKRLSKVIDYWNNLEDKTSKYQNSNHIIDSLNFAIDEFNKLFNPYKYYINIISSINKVKFELEKYNPFSFDSKDLIKENQKMISSFYDGQHIGHWYKVGNEIKENINYILDMISAMSSEE